MSLEWKTPEHEDDFIRYPVYAGKVAAVQKVRKLQVRMAESLGVTLS